jgi:hypothetical protein
LLLLRPFDHRRHAQGAVSLVLAIGGIRVRPRSLCSLAAKGDKVMSESGLSTFGRFPLALPHNGSATPIFGESRRSLAISAENSEPTRTIAALREQLAAFDSQFARIAVDDTLRVEGQSLLVGGMGLKLDSPGVERLCEQMRLPYSYLAGLDEWARTWLLNLHLMRGDLRRVGAGHGRLNAISHDGAFVGFARSDLADLPARELITGVIESIGANADDLSVHRLSLGEERVEVELIAHRVLEEVVAGDAVHGGLFISYSPLGAHAVSVETFLLRKRCGNGLRHRLCSAERGISRTRRLSRSHASADAIQLQQVRRLAAAVWAGLPARLAEVAALHEERLDDVEAFLAHLLRRARLWSGAMRGFLQEALTAEDENGTAYAALNAVTRVATHRPELTAKQRRGLSALAGLIAHRHTHICPKCYSILAR